MKIKGIDFVFLNVSKFKKSVRFYQIKEYVACFMAMVADPDGNELILHKRKDGTVG